MGMPTSHPSPKHQTHSPLRNLDKAKRAHPCPAPNHSHPHLFLLQALPQPLTPRKPSISTLSPIHSDSPPATQQNTWTRTLSLANQVTSSSHALRRIRSPRNSRQLLGMRWQQIGLRRVQRQRRRHRSRRTCRGRVGLKKLQRRVLSLPGS